MCISRQFQNHLLSYLNKGASDLELENSSLNFRSWSARRFSQMTTSIMFGPQSQPDVLMLSLTMLWCQGRCSALGCRSTAWSGSSCITPAPAALVDRPGLNWSPCLDLICLVSRCHQCHLRMQAADINSCILLAICASARSSACLVKSNWPMNGHESACAGSRFGTWDSGVYVCDHANHWLHCWSNRSVLRTLGREIMAHKMHLNRVKLLPATC